MARIQILHEAAEELAAAAAYLEEQQEGQARAFLSAYQRKLRQIVRFPESAPVIKNSPANLRLRSFSLRKFHYAIMVGVIDDVPTIVAVAHTSREPGYWRDRVSTET